MSFVGANPDAGIVAGTLQPGKVNYLIGNDPSKWYTDLPTHESITYSELYPGISLQYTGQGGKLKGTYTVAPGANPAAIRWRYAGVEKASVDDSGNLQLVATSNGIGEPVTLTEMAPIAWQETNGRKLMVNSNYVLAQDGTVSFGLGAYDPSLPLVVDPILTYSTYLGGSNIDYVSDIDGDLLAGTTSSANFPVNNAIQGTYRGSADAFVTKLSADGRSLMFSTYLGGSGADSGYGIRQRQAMYGGGIDIYVVGQTQSTDFPTLNPYQPNNAGDADAFVSVLRNDGQALLYSTYLGGSARDGAFGVGLERLSGQCCPFQNAYIVGETRSTNFPTVNAFQANLAGQADAFLVSLSGGSHGLAYSTYLGGSTYDSATHVSVGLSREAYVTGVTDSTNFPRVNAFQNNYNGGGSDAFVTKFHPLGNTVAYSTYLGGTREDEGWGIAVDSSDNAYVTGATNSTNFPIQSAFQPGNAGSWDAFVTKLTSAGNLLSYSTYLGGSNNDYSLSIGIDRIGNAYIVGSTDSTNFPTASPLQATLSGPTDAFASKFDTSGQSLAYSTYLGGSSSDYALAVAVETREPGVAYIAGRTESNNFPVRTPYQPNNAGETDGFVSHINDQCGALSNYAMNLQGGASIVPGTTDIGNHCDNCITNVTLPFTFRLYDANVTSFNVSSQGYMETMTHHMAGDNYCLPYSNWSLGYAIMPHWDRMHTNCTGCGIFTSISGTAPNRIFNIEWRTNLNMGGGAANFEARLYEGQESRFDFIYGAVSGNGSGATIGVQKKEGFLKTQYSCNQATLNSGTLITFVQLACPYQQTSTPAVTATPTTMPPTATNTPTSGPTGTPTPEPPVYCTFYQDVPPDHPDYNRIICAGCRGVMGGFPCGGSGEPCAPQNYPYFRPSVIISVTRAETARFLSRAAGFTEPPGAQFFEDVPPTHPDYEHIQRMTLRGIMSGFSCGGPGEPCVPPQNRPYFRPNNIPIRGQFARFVSNTAGFQEPPVGQTFEDVPPSHPFYEGIQRLAARGIMQGFPCGDPGEPCGPGNRPYFRPFEPMSVPRAELARIIMDTFYPGCQTVPSATPTSVPTNTPTTLPTNTSTRMPTNTPTRVATNTPVPSATPADFNDVPPTNPFYDAIRCLAGRGIVSGYDDGTFRPNNEVTRGQLAKIVSNSALYSEDPNPQIFEDVPSTNPFYQWINRLARRGHMGGYECGGPGEPCVSGKPYFRPFANATRAQTSKIVANAAVINDPVAGQAFEDVPPNHPFYLWIERLASRGVMGGYNCGGPGEPCVPPGNRAYFRPYNNVTRGQSAKIVANTFYPNCQGAARP
jgi:hypothetical protein